MNATEDQMNGKTAGSAAEVFRAFLKLGLTSFGGPIAHLGYFDRELVQRRNWIPREQYAHLVALCQFLPGPASSQIGFAIGLIRAGWKGALAAFVAFTAPSALLLYSFARLSGYLSGAFGAAAIQGLKLVAVAVVADGVLRMARKLSPDLPRAVISILAAILIVVLNSAAAQLGVVLAGALLGTLLCKATADTETSFALNYGRRVGLVLIVVFTALLISALVLANESTAVLSQLAGGFYRAGALVFGGGHVVLPLLQEAVVATGWIEQDQFLSGYGAAQAIPGPMFSIAAFLGAQAFALHSAPLGAVVCLAAIFLPGFLLVAGVLPWWSNIARQPAAARALAGVNAAVVGLLAAALYDPVWTSAIVGSVDVAIAAIGFFLLAATRSSSLVVVLWCVGASFARAAFA